MREMDFTNLVSSQKKFFADGETRPLAFRLAQLNKLKDYIDKNEAKITDALYRDLHKAPMESYLSEIMLVQDEIQLAIKQLKQWMKPVKVRTPFPLLFPGKSTIHYEPYGCVLIIAPWNYPFQLLLAPLIGAISAGNCAILKPSEHAPYTEALIKDMISELFDPAYITTVHGGPTETNQLLSEKFDYIFFTGGPQVGKIIMQAAAPHLTPVTLELGGKSPCIVDESIDLDYAARRIVWSKFVNAGQTCIAPDYLLIHEKVKASLITKIKNQIIESYGSNPIQSSSYGRIINLNHFERLKSYLASGRVVIGGEYDKDSLYIAPSVVDEITYDDTIMQEEIFGPILPVMTYDSIDAVITHIKQHEKPLALYLFTKNPAVEKKVLEQISFGGGCINDCLLQIANPQLPFGGVGQSGMGHYHGLHSFKLFSHQKSIYKKSLLFDISLAYAPYTQRKFTWLKRLLKLKW